MTTTLSNHATVLLVDSVACQVEYYRDKLGFEVGRYEADPDHYGYAQRDECSVHFAHFPNVGPKPNSIPVPPDMFDLYIYVEKCRCAPRRARRARR